MTTTTITPDSTITRVADIRMRRIQGTLTLIVDAQTYQLNETAEQAWSRCDGRPLSAIAADIAADFDVEPGVVAADLEDLFGDLRELGAVEIA
ncbi:MAG TPA: PqqD family protein [Trebonia sp.]|jgi:hypothetical protein|nr:PqqD family protein [Trebonia sp.]